MVICGAGGDLTKRKLLPALCNLAGAGLLSKQFAIVGFSRGARSDDEFRRQLTQDIQTYATAPVDPELWKWFLKRIYYHGGDFKDASVYEKLADRLAELDREHGTQGNFLYYLATAPEFFGEIVSRLHAVGLTREEHGLWRRVIVEKPFGRDLESAKSLNAELRHCLDEKQIYRIDHYLGKETVQNILVFRFSNGIFEPIWNRRYIDHVQITLAETVGVERRGSYYEQYGALRDMVPNHLFQLVSLTAMEPPVSFRADAVRDEQAKVLHAIQPPSPEKVLRTTLRGQYGEGMVAGALVPAYRAEPRVSPSSNTETFVALKLTLDNWRWADVPFYLRTGKRLTRRYTEIAIQFRRAPLILFRDTPVDRLRRNRLVLRIAPDEGISLRFGAKIPGPVMNIGAVEMNFSYVDYFKTVPNTGYERLLYDAMIGDATLFQRADMLEAGWEVIQPILDVWKALPPRSFPNYAAGGMGPPESDELLRQDGREWRPLDG
ncbi:MAG: glucose-6-phosphate dehydrogenase [Acidobacteria bacterium]|nr:MAG: glucose-6-phosphate dehydrogenase [Acidobacteriota bacterium]